MDRTCEHCNHITHDGIGKCRFCGTPFPQEAEIIEDEPEEAELEAVPVKRGKGRL